MKLSLSNKAIRRIAWSLGDTSLSDDDFSNQYYDKMVSMAKEVMDNGYDFNEVYETVLWKFPGSEELVQKAVESVMGSTGE